LVALFHFEKFRFAKPRRRVYNYALNNLHLTQSGCPPKIEIHNGLENPLRRLS
jgi:hypothetical protein